MSNQIANSALIGLLITVLGFMIKKWVMRIESKLDRISINLGKKTDREDFFNFCDNIDKRCEKREKYIIQLAENKANESDFLRHSHTQEGKIVLN